MVEANCRTSQRPPIRGLLIFHFTNKTTISLRHLHHRELKSSQRMGNTRVVAFLAPAFLLTSSSQALADQSTELQIRNHEYSQLNPMPRLPRPFDSEREAEAWRHQCISSVNDLAAWRIARASFATDGQPSDFRAGYMDGVRGVNNREKNSLCNCLTKARVFSLKTLPKAAADDFLDGQLSQCSNR
jgi:hypothetical protein